MKRIRCSIALLIAILAAGCGESGLYVTSAELKQELEKVAGEAFAANHITRIMVEETGDALERKSAEIEKVRKELGELNTALGKDKEGNFALLTKVASGLEQGRVFEINVNTRMALIEDLQKRQKEEREQVVVKEPAIEQLPLAPPIELPQSSVFVIEARESTWMTVVNSHTRDRYLWQWPPGCPKQATLSICTLCGRCRPRHYVWAPTLWPGAGFPAPWESSIE